MDESLFLISSSDRWYGDIIIYLQTQTYRSNTSRSEQRRTRYQAKDYMIVGDTLYRHGIDTVLRRCLTHEEAKKVLNDCHSGVCGGHQFGYATAQKILRAGYFWPTMFKDCITVVRSCHACQIFDRKTRTPPAPLQPVVVVGSFAKWGIDFMTCNPTSAGGMVAKFDVPQAIVTDHGSHFRNHMMVELAAKLGLSYDSSTSHYPQVNGQVEAINKVLKRMLQRMIGVHKRSWPLILYSALWAYRTSIIFCRRVSNQPVWFIVRTSCPDDEPHWLVRNASTKDYLCDFAEKFPKQCCSDDEPHWLVRNASTKDYLCDFAEKFPKQCYGSQKSKFLDETCRDATLANEAHKKRLKAQFDKSVKPCVFSEGDLVLLYDQESDKLGAGKFKSIWMGPYILKRVLTKGAYELVDYDGIPLAQPCNGLYLKRYYA
eukprot:PITA_32963